MRLSSSLSALFKDLRYGLRQCCRTPVFAVVTILTLALGIGANTAVFSVMNAIILRYLRVPDPQRLVMLRFVDQPEGSHQTGYDEASLPEQTFERFRTQSVVFSDLMAFVPLGLPKIPVRFGHDPEEAAADEVSGNFFSGLGVQVLRGRAFTLDDERQHAQVAILSYAYWMRRFAADPSVLGQTVFIKSVPFTVVGVAARDFVGLERGNPTDIWVPFQTNDQLKPWGESGPSQDNFYGAPKWFFLMMIGRLRLGVSPVRALAQLNPVYQNTVYSALGQPKAGEKIPQLNLTPARGVEGLNHGYKEPCSILMAMVGLVLLIACSNVAMLLVARNTSRQREFSVRMALGATRGAMLRQLLAESLLLVAAGGVLGWLFASFATRTLATWAKLEISLAPDKLVLLFAVLICALAALAFGIAPLRSAARVPAGLALKTKSAASGQERRQIRAGHIVVALQVAICVMLLAGSGLLVRTLLNLERANLGLEAKGLVVFGVTPPQSVRSDGQAVQFFDAILGRLRSLPEVESATLLNNRLGVGWSNNTGVYVDGVVPNGKKFAPLRWNIVGSDFAHVLNVPLLIGRDFNDADSSTSAPVAIVNQTFANNYLKDRSPIGHRISWDVGQPSYTIVGVVADSKYTAVREDPRPMAYFPFTQVPGIATMQIELRTRGSPLVALDDARQVVKDFGPDLPLLQPMTQEEQFRNSFSDDRMFARLSVFFGFLAAVLVATGLYGTLAYRVNRRTAEIGVRMALGAQRHQVLWMVLRESLLISALGVAVGFPAAIACARLLRSMLFNLTPGDPITFVLVLAGISLVTVLAAAVPARRAASVDPILALREE
jgi:predicted permease